MLKVHDLSKAGAKRARITGRFAVGAVIAAAVVIVGAASLTSRGDLATNALGTANATNQATPAEGTTPSRPTGDRGSPVDEREFDYFPSHYRNQATEPAEPIATF